ncbi:hypothetical protein BH24ACT15_BH24ACT15_08070 [soil metagenome]
MAGVVAVVALTVASLQGQRGDPVDVADPPATETDLSQPEVEGLTPLSQWPNPIDFAGVEVAVEVFDAPNEPIQSRVPLGRGEAGLNYQPSDLAEVGNTTMQAFINRVWFGCGTGQVVRMMESDRADDAPAFTGPGSGRWLPAGALLAAVEQFSTEMGCVPVAPAGTPAAITHDNGLGHELAVKIDQAGLVTCCADSRPVGNSPDRLISLDEGSRWSVLIDDQVLPLTFGDRDAYPPALESVQTSLIADGQAVTSPDGQQIAATCFDTTTIAVTKPSAPTKDRFEQFLRTIDCQPAIPPAFVNQVALGWLQDSGVPVVGEVTETAETVSVTVSADDSELEIRAGRADLLGLTTATLTKLAETPVVVLNPDTDGHGAAANCGIHFGIFAQDEQGADRALELADQLRRHPGCDGTIATPGAQEDSGETATTATDLIAALQASGRDVTDQKTNDGSATFKFQPTADGANPVDIEAGAISLPPGTVTAQTALVRLGDGEAAQLDDRSLLLVCDGLPIRTAGVEPDDPGLEWIAELPAVAGCTPRPPGISEPVQDPSKADEQVGMSIREARIRTAAEAMGMTLCCGDPSASPVTTNLGFIWEGIEVYVSAGWPVTDLPEYQPGQIIPFADGQADLGDGDGLPGIAFDCGDSNYSVTHDSGNTDMHIRAAEALVDKLGCQPRVAG